MLRAGLSPAHSQKGTPQAVLPKSFSHIWLPQATCRFPVWQRSHQCVSQGPESTEGLAGFTSQTKMITISLGLTKEHRRESTMSAEAKGSGGVRAVFPCELQDFRKEG